MTEWIALKPPPAVGHVIRFREEVPRRGHRPQGWRILDAEVIRITGNGGRDDSLTLKVLGATGEEGKISLVGRGILRRGADVYRPDSQLRVI